MFHKSYVRGVANALTQGGYVSFPDEDSAAKIADYIADRVDIAPHERRVDKATTAKIAEHLVDASNHLKKQPGFKAASFSKIASVEDLSKLAHQHALHLMEKAAEGSTIEGGDKGNKENSSAEGKMDASARPPGYATDSLGKTDVDTKPGAVGKEQEQPNKPAESPAGSNSVTDQSKTSSLGQLIAKLAEGSTIIGGDKGNKEPTNAEGKMDAALRPPGYAVLPSQGDLGELMKRFDGQSAVGKESPHPVQPGQTPGGSNSLTETSAKSGSVEDSYLHLFKKVATEVSPYLPGTLSDDAKVAHVRACMGMTTEEKAYYLNGISKEAADKTTPHLPPGARGDDYQKHNADATHSRAGAYDGRNANQGTKQAEMPDFIQAKIDAKKDGEGGEKKDGDKDEKKDANPFAKKDDDKGEKKDDEKEGSLKDHFRRINAAVQPRV